MAYPQSGVLSPEDQAKLDALPKAYIAVKSDLTYPSISTDSNSPEVFAGLEQEGSASGFEAVPSLGGVRNISGRTISAFYGVNSLHTVSTNNSSVTIRLFSTISTDDIVFTVNADSGRQEVVGGQSEAYSSKASQAFDIPNNAVVRFEAYSTGVNLSVAPVSFAAKGGTVTGPSFRWWIKEA